MDIEIGTIIEYTGSNSSSKEYSPPFMIGELCAITDILDDTLYECVPVCSKFAPKRFYRGRLRRDEFRAVNCMC